MRVPPLTASLSAGAAVACLFVGCSGAASEAGTFHCSPSQPSPHPGGASGYGYNSAASFNFGNKLLRAELPAHGHLIAGTLPDGGSMAIIERDGAITTKLGWWRGLQGRLVISGHRLDKKAAPLKADLPPLNSYGATGFIPSGLTFPTTGCWRVSGKLGRAHLSFVLSVTKVHP
jgi:hypothetical protein